MPTFAELVKLAHELKLPGREAARRQGKDALIRLIESGQQNTTFKELESLARKMNIPRIKEMKKDDLSAKILEVLKANPNLLDNWTDEELRIFMTSKKLRSSSDDREGWMTTIQDHLQPTTASFTRKRNGTTDEPPAKRRRKQNYAAVLENIL
jgi:hypothetical protein